MPNSIIEHQQDFKDFILPPMGKFPPLALNESYRILIPNEEGQYQPKFYDWDDVFRTFPGSHNTIWNLAKPSLGGFKGKAIILDHITHDDNWAYKLWMGRHQVQLENGNWIDLDTGMGVLGPDEFYMPTYGGNLHVIKVLKK